MEKVFSYGTLQDPKIQQKLLQRTLESLPDSIRGFRLSQIPIHETLYFILIPDTKQQKPISGAVLSISSSELKKFDLYEGAEYQRSLVRLESGCNAWVYHQ